MLKNIGKIQSCLRYNKRQQTFMSSRALKHSSQSLGIDSSMSSTDRPLRRSLRAMQLWKGRQWKIGLSEQLKQKKNQSLPQGFSQLEKERGAGHEIAKEFGPSLTDEP